MKNVQDLIDSLGNNIKYITYDTSLNQWIIKYHNGLNKDFVNTEMLEEFLCNA